MPSSSEPSGHRVADHRDDVVDRAQSGERRLYSCPVVGVEMAGSGAEALRRGGGAPLVRPVIVTDAPASPAGKLS
jgi:hypothetical protein